MKQLLPVLLSLACHVGTSYKFKGDPTSDQEWTDVDIASEGPDPIKKYGPHADLSMALSLVLTNLSNYSGLINSRDRPHSANLTHYFGVDPHQDLLMLYDKVQGFYEVLHEAMGENASRYCPFHAEIYIPGCIEIAMCLVSRDVPKYMPEEAYASILEQVTRFETIIWEAIKYGLGSEDPTEIGADFDIPKEFVCDENDHSNDHSASLLQSDASQTSAVSLAMHHATRSTHQILAEHTTNASLDHTVNRLEEAWHPVCNVLGCDHTNFLDIHLASHRHSMALMQGSSTSQLHAHIKSRQKLHVEMVRFTNKHGAAFADKFYRSDAHAHSEEAFRHYAEITRRAVLNHLLPMPVILNNETKALRWVDRVEFGKFFKSWKERNPEGNVSSHVGGPDSSRVHGYMKASDIRPQRGRLCTMMGKGPCA